METFNYGYFVRADEYL